LILASSISKTAYLGQSPFPVVAPAAPAPVGGALITPAGSLPVDSPVTNVFNYAALPSDVQLFYCEHADRSLMMTRSTIVIEFGSWTLQELQ